MKTATLWRAGSASDPGLQRQVNEDRVFVDESRGIFMVVDGLGGHAAGETAAETAVEVISKALRSARVLDEPAVRSAITAANNEIFRLSEANPSWRGMACVLTLAIASGDKFLIGHVGDSRLYLFWNGKLQKMTCDHSPVGELEDSGEINEEQAMNHPRRNEVFRDVGSFLHNADDARFIEIRQIDFHPDAALLLCSDGLTDLVRAADMTRIIERYDGDAQRVVHLLIDAANTAGGRDNISVVFVPGPEFLGIHSEKSAEGRNRHATTRMRNGKSGSRAFLRNMLILALGMALGLGGWFGYQKYAEKPAPPVVVTPAPHIPKELAVDAADPNGIAKALEIALPGDTVLVPAGEFLGPVVLKDHVNVVGPAQGAVPAVIRTPAATSDDAGIAIIARGLKDARVKNLHVAADATHPLKTGLLISDSSIEAEDLDISGASDCGVRVTGDASHPLVMAGNFHGNSGPGIIVQGQSAPRLMDNRIADNGRISASPRPGIEIDNQAQPTLQHNEITHNGVPSVFPLALDEEIRSKNIVDPKPASSAKPHAPAHVEKSTKPDVKPITPSHPVKPLTAA